jgi:hypothetical protein
MKAPLAPTACLSLLVLWAAACPAAPAADERRFPSVGHTEVDDPRIVADTEDLYEREDAPEQPEAEAAPGSGRPDEQNGVCRLYAPKLPSPECCPYETGFDAEDVRTTCGLEVYLGESMQGSCGYHFLPDAGGSEPVFFRGSLIMGELDDAIAAHEKQLRRLTGDENAKTAPVPGVEGAVWSSAKGVSWAHVPGWSRPRLLTWQDSACGREKVVSIIARFKDAPEPPEKAARLGLVPARRPAPDQTPSQR